MLVRSKTVLVALTLGIASCSSDNSGAKCEAPSLPLKSTAQLTSPPELTMVVRYRISADGMITRAEETFDDNEFAQILSETAQFHVLPIYIFEVSDQVPCARLNAIRKQLNDAELCKQGNCFEGELPEGWIPMGGT